MTNPAQQTDAPAIATGELERSEARRLGLPLCVPPDSKDEIAWLTNDVPILVDKLRGILGGTISDRARAVLGGGRN